MIHSTRRHNEENVNGWELRQAPPQQVTRPLTHPIPQVNHHCDGDTTHTLACECPPGQAKRVRPQQRLGPHVDTHHRTDDDGGSVSMLRTVVIICATFLTSQRCTAVSIDARIAVARFPSQLWSSMYAWSSVPLGFVKIPTLRYGCGF